MKTLLQKKNSPNQELPEPPAMKPPSREQNRLFILVPDGAFTYRLAALPDVPSASRYVDTNLIPGQSFLAFWAHHPGAGANGTRGEALVLVREEGRPDVVQPYSFTDAARAHDFLEREVGASVDPTRILFVWAEPADIPRGTTPMNAAPALVSDGGIAAASGSAATAQAAGASTAAAEEQTEISPGLISRIADWPGWDGLGPLVAGAALGRKRTYYEVLDEDEHAGGQAALILAVGWTAMALTGLTASALGPLWHLVFAVLGWSLGACVIYGAAKILAGGQRPRGAWRRLLVAMGFAYAPGALLFLGLMPVFGPLLLLGVLIWIAGTSAVAVTTSLELEMDTGAVIAFAGWLVMFAVTLIVPSVVL